MPCMEQGKRTDKQAVVLLRIEPAHRDDLLRSRGFGNAGNRNGIGNDAALSLYLRRLHPPDILRLEHGIVGVPARHDAAPPIGRRLLRRVVSLAHDPVSTFA